MRSSALRVRATVTVTLRVRLRVSVRVRGRIGVRVRVSVRIRIRVRVRSGPSSETRSSTLKKERTCKTSVRININPSNEIKHAKQSQDQCKLGEPEKIGSGWDHDQCTIYIVTRIMTRVVAKANTWEFDCFILK